jgi:hypothetical protein
LYTLFASVAVIAVGTSITRFSHRVCSKESEEKHEKPRPLLE